MFLYVNYLNLPPAVSNSVKKKVFSWLKILREIIMQILFPLFCCYCQIFRFIIAFRVVCFMTFEKKPFNAKKKTSGDFHLSFLRNVVAVVFSPRPLPSFFPHLSFGYQLFYFIFSIFFFFYWNFSNEFCAAVNLRLLAILFVLQMNFIKR